MAGTVITKKGLQLIAKLMASGTALTFTRVSVGTGSVPAGYDPGSMTDLNNYKMDGSISSCSFLGDEASIIMQISSLGVEVGFTITETGLFATDPDEGEILYSYLDLSKDPQYVYEENSAISKFVEMTLVVKVGTVERVTAQLNPRSLLTRDGDISDTSINELEPIDTKYPVPAAGETAKVFMGKVKKYIEDTKPLDADMFIYVSTTGSNATGDGTSSKPYKTITYALSKLPKSLNGRTAGIVVASGAYAEAVYIDGINGDLQLLLQGNITLNNLTVTQADLTIGSFTGSEVLLMLQWVAVRNASRVYADSKVNISVFGTVTPTFTPTSHGMYCFDSQLYMSGIIVLTGNPSIGIAAYANSNVFLGTVTGGGMNIGLAADRSKIACIANRTTTSGVPSVGQYGGVIVSGYGARIGTLSNDVTIYVATTGSDSYGDGTSTKPYKTIQYAINTLPKDLGSSFAVIYIADGTYDEGIVCSGFYNGVLVLQRQSFSNDLAETCKVKSVYIQYCQARVDVNGLYFTLASTNASAFLVSSCSNVVAYYSQLVGSQHDAFGFDYIYSKGIVSNCRCIGKYACLRVYAAEVVSKDWTSDSSARVNGIVADMGTIKKIGRRPTALSGQHEFVMRSGMTVNENGTQISDLISDGLSCTWGTIRGGYIRHGNSTGTAMITIQVNVYTSTVLSEGSNYEIAGFPLPTNPYDIAVATNRPSLFDHTHFRASLGRLSVSPTTNLNAGQSIIFNCTYITNS